MYVDPLISPRSPCQYRRLLLTYVAENEDGNSKRRWWMRPREMNEYNMAIWHANVVPEPPWLPQTQRHQYHRLKINGAHPFIVQVMKRRRRGGGYTVRWHNRLNENERINDSPRPQAIPLPPAVNSAGVIHDAQHGEGTLSASAAVHQHPSSGSSRMTIFRPKRSPRPPRRYGKDWEKDDASRQCVWCGDYWWISLPWKGGKVASHHVAPVKNNHLWIVLNWRLVFNSSIIFGFLKADRGSAPLTEMSSCMHAMNISSLHWQY